MSERYLRDLAHGAVLGRRLVAARPDVTPEHLAHLLRRHWWLGPGQARAVVQAQRRHERRTTPATPWRTWGAHWQREVHTHGDLLHLYLGCAPGTALQAVAAVTARASTWDEPWLLSSRAVHQRLPEPDATVLCFPVGALDDLRPHLVGLVGDLRPLLAAQTPLLTLPVGRGAGLAQGRSTRSVGTRVCRLLAGAVLRTRSLPLPDTQQALLATLAEDGLDPTHPYRGCDATWRWSAPRRTAAA